MASPLTTIVFAHHVTKAGYGAGKASLRHTRGSGKLAGIADVILETIKQDSTHPALIKLELHMPKRKAFPQMGGPLDIELDLRQAGRETWKIAQKQPEDEDEENSGNSEPCGNLQEPIRAKILQLAPTAKFTSANSAFKRLGGTRAEVLKAWNYLVDSGQLRKSGKFFIAEQAAERNSIGECISFAAIRAALLLLVICLIN